MTPILTIDRLNRRFGDREVVRRLDLVLEPGERVALRGPNGSGKSTVLRCVAGTLLPSGGSISVGSHPADTPAARRLTGVSLSQERSFYLRLSGRANLVFFARVRGHSRAGAERVVDAIGEELELQEILEERTDRCSTGMVLQLAFARALIDDPPLLLLDEPTRSLDRAAVERLWSALDRRPGAAALIPTHREDDVERCHSSIEFPV